MSKLVYLAGPITGCTYEGCTNWREYARKELAEFHIEGVSPMRYKEYLKHMTERILDRYDETVLSSAKGITHRDKWDVCRCDVILVNLLGAERVSIGTMLEVGMATARDKPIVLCIEEGNIHHHSMLETFSGWVVPDFDDGIEIVKALLL